MDLAKLMQTNWIQNNVTFEIYIGRGSTNTLNFASHNLHIASILLDLMLILIIIFLLVKIPPSFNTYTDSYMFYFIALCIAIFTRSYSVHVGFGCTP